MSAFPVASRVAQVIGFTGAAWLAGNFWLDSVQIDTRLIAGV